VEHQVQAAAVLTPVMTARRHLDVYRDAAPAITTCRVEGPVIVDPAVELLAPVPLDLLRDARDELGASEVALGSRAWEVFRRLDGLRSDRPVRVWIYASHNPAQPVPPSATWSALYMRQVESIGGAHPQSARYRSTLARPEDGIAFWAIYWHVVELTELPPNRYRPVAEMQGLGQRRPYGHPFEPEGPMLIEPVG